MRLKNPPPPHTRSFSSHIVCMPVCTKPRWGPAGAVGLSLSYLPRGSFSTRLDTHKDRLIGGARRQSENM